MRLGITLELAHLGNADPAWTAKKSSPILTALRDARISIIDWNAPPRVFEDDRDEHRDDHGNPENAIVDFGLDYGDGADWEDEEKEESGLLRL